MTSWLDLWHMPELVGEVAWCHGDIDRLLQNADFALIMSQIGSLTAFSISVSHDYCSSKFMLSTVLLFIYYLYLVFVQCTCHQNNEHNHNQTCIFLMSGCRNALINVEARPITAAIFTRKCIIAKLKELTIEKYKEMVQQNAGGLLVLIPTDLGALDKEEKEVC